MKQTMRNGVEIMLALAGLFGLVAPASGKEPAPGDSPRPVLVFVAARDFAWNEFTAVTAALAEAGLPVTVTSTDTLPALAANDSTVKPDVALGDVDPAGYPALVLVGGIGSIICWKDSLVLDRVREFAAVPGNVIGAIGVGPILLAKTGLLKGRLSAVYPDPNGVKLMEQEGVRVSPRDLVVDGSFVTANGPEAAGKLTRALVRRVRTGKW